MTALLLAAVLSQADAGSADAGSRWARPLYALCPAAAPRVLLDGGWSLMPPERTARLDCIMVTADERVLQLEAVPPPFGSASLIFAAGLGLLGLLFGFYGGWELRGLFR